MRKDELVAALAERTGLSKSRARDAVSALFGTRSTPSGIISEELATGASVQIGDFGTFGTRHAANGADSGLRPYFHPSSMLRRRLEKPAR